MTCRELPVGETAVELETPENLETRKLQIPLR